MSVLVLGAVGCASVGTCEKSPATTLTLMSYNIRAGVGTDDVWNIARSVDVVKKVKPDVLCLQEVDVGTSRSFGLHEPQAMGHMLRPISHWSFSKTLATMGGEYGIAMLYATQPLATEKLIYPRDVKRDEPRSLLIAEFRDYVVCSTHLSLRDDERLFAVDTMVKAAARYQKPFFIAGDFNSTPDSPFMKELTKHFTILSDATIKTAPANRPTATIDYVVVDNAHAARVTVEKFEVLNEPEASDHLPLAIRLAIR